ncbi:MAG: HAMP domain-containing protein [Proteobacteria bacterium]|nr:HAMP domain-containing protein [Pseudomonadota bacterium]
MTLARLRQFLPQASIRRKLVLGVAFVHLLLMTIFVVDLVQRQRDFLWDELTRRTLHHAHVLAVSSSPWVLSDDLVGMEEVVEGSASGSGVRHAMIVDPNGRILAHTDRNRIGQYLADAMSLEALAGARTARVYQQSETAIHALSPILAADKLIGWSILTVDKGATLAHLAYVTKTGLFYTLAAIAIGTIFAMLLSRSILRQLRHLLRGVDNLSKDVLDAPVKIVSRDEVGRVAEAFNRALASLADGRRRLTAEVGERRRAEEALRMLSRRQAGAIEEERKRIARDLHDELGQALSGMQFRLRSMQSQTANVGGGVGDTCARLAVEVERMGASIHRIANALRPATLDHLGLLPAIQAFVAGQLPLINDRMSIAVDAAGFRRRLPADVEMIAYRIVQEGLTNVIKHAEATHADILLTVNHPSLIVTIRDNGVGIAAPAERFDGRGADHGNGLLGMEERAAAIGGKVEVKPRQGGGTILRAELPYAAGEAVHA